MGRGWGGGAGLGERRRWERLCLEALFAHGEAKRSHVWCLPLPPAKRCVPRSARSAPNESPYVLATGESDPPGVDVAPPTRACAGTPALRPARGPARSPPLAAAHPAKQLRRLNPGRRRRRSDWLSPVKGAVPAFEAGRRACPARPIQRGAASQIHRRSGQPRSRRGRHRAPPAPHPIRAIEWCPSHAPPPRAPPPPRPIRDHRAFARRTPPQP